MGRYLGNYHTSKYRKCSLSAWCIYCHLLDNVSIVVPSFVNHGRKWPHWTLTEASQVKYWLWNWKSPAQEMVWSCSSDCTVYNLQTNPAQVNWVTRGARPTLDTEHHTTNLPPHK